MQYRTRKVDLSYLQEKLTNEVARASRYNRHLSVLFINVIFFNDSDNHYDHKHIDQELYQVGRIIEENIRQTDLIARYSGEKFVIVMPETSKQQGQIVVEKLRRAVEAKHTDLGDGQTDMKVTINAGLATLGEDGSSGSDLFKQADQAIGEAKPDVGNAV